MWRAYNAHPAREGRSSMNVDHYRDMAEHFRRLAEVEPLATLRRHLKRLAEQHDQMAAELEQQTSPPIAADWVVTQAHASASLSPCAGEPTAAGISIGGLSSLQREPSLRQKW